MIEFKQIELSDKKWVTDILKECDYMSCEYSFGNHFIWKKAYDILIANIDGFYVAALHTNNRLSFLYPAGKGDVKPVISKLMEYCREKSISFHMHSLTAERKQELETIFPNAFEYKYNRGHCDYIYAREDLATLRGKKYHGKRNHIKRFKENNWSFEVINEMNFKECIEMNEKWCERNNCNEDPEKMKEICAVKRAFKYFNELDFFGGILRVDGQVIAYTIGERLNSNTVVVHIEKAFSDIQGAYPCINQEFVLNMTSGYEYINREEDLGIEGLRKAKLSYNPSILLDKYSANLL